MRAEAEAAARFKSTDELLAEEEAAAESERRRLIELQAQAAREREAREMREAEDRRRAELMGMDITQYERWKLEHEGGEDADWEDSEFDWDAMDFSNAPPEVFDQIMEIMPEMQQARRASLQSTGLRKNPSPPPLGLTPKSPSKSLERSASARQINERIQAIISSPDASPERQQEERERRNAKMGLGHSPEARETRRQHIKADIAQVRAEAAATAARQHEEERRSRSSSPGAPLEVRGRSPSRTTAASLAEGGLPPGGTPSSEPFAPANSPYPPGTPLSAHAEAGGGALPPAHIVSPHILSGGVPKEPGQLSPGRQVLVSGEIRAYEADVAAAAAAASAPPPFARARSPGTSIGSPASPPPPSWYPDHPDSLHSSGSPSRATRMSRDFPSRDLPSGGPGIAGARPPEVHGVPPQGSPSDMAHRVLPAVFPSDFPSGHAAVTASANASPVGYKKPGEASPSRSPPKGGARPRGLSRSHRRRARRRAEADLGPQGEHGGERGAAGIRRGGPAGGRGRRG